MYRQLLENITRKTQEINGEKIFVAFKGFPNYFIIEASENIHFHTDFSVLFDTDNKINLEGIFNDLPDLISSLRNKETGRTLLLYEELIQLQKNYISLPVQQRRMFFPNYNELQFIIIENNHLSEIPNQSNRTSYDVYDNIEEDLNSKEDDVFNAFYSYSTVFKEIGTIKYQDLEQTENFHLLNAFGDLPEIEYQKSNSENISANWVDATSSDYQEMKYKMFLDKQFDMKNIVLKNFTKTVEDDLRIFSFICRENNIQPKFYLEDFTSENTFRPKLLDILQHHWQTDKIPEPKFRNLHFYKKPDINAEKIEYSQGAIAEIIVKQVEKSQSSNETENQNYKNIFLTAPTGSGKSVLYQIPAIYLAEQEQLVTIVIVPLIALMESAIKDLKEKYNVQNCAYINSSLTYSQREQTINQLQSGEISLLFLSPELFISFGNLSFLGNRKLGLLVIDEAHTVSTWGQEFRADYWNLGNHIRKLRKYNNDQNFPILAMTATATYGGENDMVYEIIKSLKIEFPEPIILIGNVRRDYISFNINQFRPTTTNRYETEKKEKTKQYITDSIDKGVKSLIYFPWVRTNNEVFARVPAQYLPKVVQYHGQLSNNQKRDAVYRFSKNLAIEACATKAFGMGIDIPDIKQVYHFAVSGNLTDYVQEIGRLRQENDENDKPITKYAITDYGYKDLSYNKRLFFFSSIKQYEVRLALKKIHAIFEKKRKYNYSLRNFLVSIDDFSFITGEDNEDKIKRMLLMIERDFHPYIIIRPKSIFSTVFAEIPDAVKNAFLGQYSYYSENTGIKKSLGDVYKINLDKIWEHSFKNLTFPQVKREFFEKSLFKKFNHYNEKQLEYRQHTIYPNLKLSLELLENSQTIITEITEYFDNLRTVFSSIGRHYFLKEELLTLLKDYIPENDLRDRLVDYFLLLFSRKHEVQSQNKSPYTFLIWQYFDKEKKYLIDFGDFSKVKSLIIKKINTLISGKKGTISTYITANPTGNEITVRVLYLFEILQLGTYELSGGEKPQIFIRINDPDKLEYQVRNINKYRNSFITRQNKQFDWNNDIFHQFFTSKINDEQRWDFIEDYFLGKPVLETEKDAENHYSVLLESPKGENNGSQIAALIKNIQKIEIGKAYDNVMVDFTNINFLHPIFVLPFSVYLRELNVSYQNHEQIKSYLDIIHFYNSGIQINLETDIENEFKVFSDKNYIGLVSFPVAGDENLRNFSNIVVGKIEKLLIQKAGLAPNVMQGFKYIVSEVVDNVFEHSGTNRAWIFAQYYPQKEYFDLCILDIGKGIFGSYKDKGFDEIKTNKEAIENAITGNSTKEYNTERGYGLTTTIKITKEGFEGDYILISGDMLFFNDKIIQIPISWQGTIVAFRLNKNRPNLNLYNYVE